MRIQDLTEVSAKKARDFLPFLHRSRRIPAVVEYVLSGHRFKLLIPKETCSVAFSFSGVRCPVSDEAFSDEAIALLRRKIMRDLEIEVETVDRTGTFLGSLWESRSNMAVPLFEAGLAKLQTSFGGDRIPGAHLLEQAEESAKRQQLKIWENYVEGEEVSNGPTTVENKPKELLQLVVTGVLGGGKFYVQTVGDQGLLSIQQQLASLSISVLIREEVPYNQLRPLDPSVSASPGLAQLCSLAFLKFPTLNDEYGDEAAQFLTEQTLRSSLQFTAVIEERDISG